MVVTEIKPIEFMIENSIVIRVDSGSMIDFDGKVCFHNEDNNALLSMLDKGLLAAALHKKVTKEEMDSIETKIAAFVSKGNCDEQVDGNFTIVINKELAYKTAFYIEEEDTTVKFDRTLVCTDSPLDSVQKLLGIKVFRALKK